MSKLLTITLKEQHIVEKDGEFHKEYFNERKVPAAITNYSLSLGADLGLIEGSQITDLGDIQSLYDIAVNPDKSTNDMAKALENVNADKFLKVIYLAVAGVNKNINLTYEEFLDLYHEDIATIVNTYSSLVIGTMKEGMNNFSKGLVANTKKK